MEAPRPIEDKPVNSRLYIPCSALRGFNSSHKHIKGSCFSDGIYRFSEETTQQCNDSFVKKPTERLSKHVQAVLYPSIPSNVFSLAKGWFANLLSTFLLTHNSVHLSDVAAEQSWGWIEAKAKSFQMLQQPSFLWAIRTQPLQSIQLGIEKLSVTIGKLHLLCIIKNKSQSLIM